MALQNCTSSFLTSLQRGHLYLYYLYAEDILVMHVVWLHKNHIVLCLRTTSEHSRILCSKKAQRNFFGGLYFPLTAHSELKWVHTTVTFLAVNPNEYSFVVKANLILVFKGCCYIHFLWLILIAATSTLTCHQLQTRGFFEFGITCVAAKCWAPASTSLELSLKPTQYILQTGSWRILWKADMFSCHQIVP